MRQTVTRLKTQNSKLKTRFQKRRGQVLVEFAFVVSILLVLTMGLIQYGLIYNTANTLTNITREGARYMAVHGTETGAQANTRAYVRTVAGPSSVRAADLPDANIIIETVPVNQPLSSGIPIKVRTIYNMRNKFFLPVNRFPGLSNFDTTYETSATMVLE